MTLVSLPLLVCPFCLTFIVYSVEKDVEHLWLKYNYKDFAIHSLIISSKKQAILGTILTFIFDLRTAALVLAMPGASLFHTLNVINV